MTKEELRNEWIKRVKNYQESGLSMTKWCKETGNKLHQLQYWLKKYENKKVQKEEPIKWMPLNLNSSISQSDQNEHIKLKIGKCEIEIGSEFNEAALRKVISVVNELC